MTHPGGGAIVDADAFAVLLCDWSLDVGSGQQVLIETTTLAQEPALALHRAVLERDAWPLLRLRPPGLEADFYRHAQARHLDDLPPLAELEARSAERRVRIEAPGDTRPLAGVDPALAARAARAAAPLRRARRDTRSTVTIWPTPALAQRAGMNERDYAAFVGGALFLDRPEPAACWRELSERQARLIARLTDARIVRIEAERTDLTLDVSGCTWVNSDGRRNMPSGEVFTGPHERSANGHIHFGIPSYGRGAEVSGVELEFADGEIVRAHADEGAAQLHAALATDPGARLLGELGIGTNTGIDRPTGSTLLDEKMAGTVHLALGSSYPETGAVNESALHWDLICDLRGGGRVTIDGEMLIENGTIRE